MKPVREFLVIQRINRRLAEKHGKFGSPLRPRIVLKKAKPGNVKTLGDFYILDVYSNTVYDDHVNLEKTARDLNALTEWETLAEERTRKKGS